ncbi:MULTISPECIES: hypothetical protein [Actinomyces]|uniref:5'-nucleotidase n=1 Tax=Actinomyces respiraculi TaxID=2744574 RepID=A0A7T0LK05_9ACTO|nr:MULTISPECIES: hypothetical protein [Actinomyces]QPL05176.1 hypothetical protein ID810_10690 [Actinomyces respiraculi]
MRTPAFMRSAAAVATLAVAALSPVAAAPALAAEGDTTTINILGITDLHGHIETVAGQADPAKNEPGAGNGTWVTEVDSIRVGFVGVVTDELPTLTATSGLAGLTITDATATTAENIDLAASGGDVAASPLAARVSAIVDRAKADSEAIAPVEPTRRDMLVTTGASIGIGVVAVALLAVGGLLVLRRRSGSDDEG